MGESEKVESWVEKMFEAMPMNLVGQAILFAVCSLSMHLIPHSSDSFGQAGFQSEAGSQLTQLCLNPCSVSPGPGSLSAKTNCRAEDSSTRHLKTSQTVTSLFQLKV